MGRVRQHSRRCPRTLWGEIRTATGLAALVGVLALLAPGGALAQQGKGRGCATVPGDPQQAAILQYCPKKVERSAEGDPASPTGAAAAGGQPGGPGGSEGASGARPTPAQPQELPLIGYPSTDTVNVVFWILLAVLALIGGRFLYRRYLSDRIGGGPTLPTRGAAGR